MPVNTLRKIWLAVALIDVIVCLDFLSVVQGWPVNIGTSLVIDLKLSGFTKGQRLQAALYGLITALPFLVMAMWLASLHAQRSSGGFPQRLPFRLLDVDPASKDGKVIQRIAFVVTFLLPLFAVGHFWRKVLSQSLCFEYIPAPGAPKATARDVPIFTLDWKQGTGRSIWSILDNDFRFAPTQSDGCDGPTFQPFLEPVVLAAVTALALWFFGRFLWLAFRGDRRAARAAAPVLP